MNMEWGERIVRFWIRLEGIRWVPASCPHIPVWGVEEQVLGPASFLGNGVQTRYWRKQDEKADYSFPWVKDRLQYVKIRHGERQILKEWDPVFSTLSQEARSSGKSIGSRDPEKTPPVPASDPDFYGEKMTNLARWLGGR